MRVAIHRTDGGVSLMHLSAKEFAAFVYDKATEGQNERPESIEISNDEKDKYLLLFAEQEVKKWDRPHDVSELVSWELIPDNEIIPDERDAREAWKASKKK